MGLNKFAQKQKKLIKVILFIIAVSMLLLITIFGFGLSKQKEFRKIGSAENLK
ncbi:MAG: hypothetical protein KAS66_10335 [Candidatus Omnitrophica bacterium]|nr:hypothetical protein [Candidatus Omnitrophota bacterium]